MGEHVLPQATGIAIDMKNTDQAWRQTKSGKVFARVQTIGQHLGRPVSIENRDGMVETFRCGEEHAVIVKRLEGGTVGASDGSVESCIEAYQYKRLPWWREAIDTSDCSFTLFDTPVFLAAKDAGVPNYEAVFRPSGIVAAHGLSKEALFQVTELMRKEINPLVFPDYEVRDQDGGLRLIALTEEAVKSRTEDNELYRKVVAKIGVNSPQLLQRYENLRRKRP